jgi:hypothetical protein
VTGEAQRAEGFSLRHCAADALRAADESALDHSAIREPSHWDVPQGTIEQVVAKWLVWVVVCNAPNAHRLFIEIEIVFSPPARAGAPDVRRIRVDVKPTGDVADKVCQIGQPVFLISAGASRASSRIGSTSVMSRAPR